ncbi:MAG: 2Fe-2S iron-sulfur cluster-binding protein [Acidimicrobiia bacterium]|nr:2Fe-2S iron-sulfur cluster-binding protein [Acidimicrobiia bacterium]
MPRPKGPDEVTLTIDGKVVTAPNGTLLITVAEEHGTYIPRFCYQARMKPVGMCRMCLVEVEGMRGFQISCATPVADGMVVHTNSESVKKVQDGILEFLLVNHPLDCPVCDRGGECPLQDQTLAFGPGESRFVEEKRHFEKPVPISDLVMLDRERCIQCGRCTRFADEIAGDPLIDFGARGCTPRSSPSPTSRSRPTSRATPCRSALWVHSRRSPTGSGRGRGTSRPSRRRAPRAQSGVEGHSSRRATGSCACSASIPSP